MVNISFLSSCIFAAVNSIPMRDFSQFYRLNDNSDNTSPELFESNYSNYNHNYRNQIVNMVDDMTRQGTRNRITSVESNVFVPKIKTSNKPDSTPPNKKQKARNIRRRMFSRFHRRLHN